MPFLEYSFTRNEGPVERFARGFQQDFWDTFADLTTISDQFGLTESQISRRLLHAGPCPGLWRVFYAITEEVAEDAPVETTMFLCRETRSRTRRELGKDMERWTAQANRICNEFLGTWPLDFSVLERIATPTLREFYRERSVALAANLTREDEIQACVMSVDEPFQVFPGLPLTDSTPDGAFVSGTTGAVFESKLTRPAYDTFDREMAAYAVVVERVKRVPVDYAIVLHSDLDSQTLGVFHERITDSSIQAVLLNVERFRDLVLYGISSLARRGVAPQSIREWRDLLERPPGAPPMENREPCGTCRHKTTCWREGGIS